MMRTERLAVSTLALAVRGALAAMLVLPVAAVADEEPTVASLTKPTNTVEVGAENVSQSSAKFGEYNGMDKSGGYLIGNFKVRGGDAYNSFDGGQGTTRWEVKGSDLGTDARELSGSVSNQGQWSLGIGYDQLRRHLTDSYQTPLLGSMGGNSFILPDAFGGVDVNNAGAPVLTAAQQASFQTQKVYTDRKNSSFNAGYIFDPQWSIQFDYNHLEQSGAKLLGISSDDQTLTGAGENTLTLMNPTNYKTDTYELALNWVGDKGHLTAGYFASIFKDGYDSVSFASPYFNSGGGGAFPVPANSYATPPNNSFHQLNLTGGYDFSSATRLAGGFSYSRNTQNSAFINDPLMAAGQPLPTGSLDGLVVNTHVDLKLTHQASRDLALSAGLKYDERDNRTSSNNYGTFSSIAGDTYTGGVVNTPLSNKKTQFEFAGSYRIDKAQSLRLAFEHEQIKRWCNNALANSFQSSDPLLGVTANVPGYYTTSACVQVRENDENKLSANYRLKAAAGIAFNAGYSYARRRSDINASYYNPMQTNSDGLPNSGFVGYFDATRTEQLLKAGVTWQATEKLSLGVNGRYLDDKYDVTLGVQKGHTWGLNLDGTYAYGQNGTISAYYSAQRRQRDLLSSGDHSPLVPVAPDTFWTNRLTDDSDTFGLTLKQKGLMAGKLELTGDLSYSFGKTTYSTDGSACTNANCTGGVFAQSDVTGALPTIRNEFWRLKIGGVYQLDKASKIGVAYVYQKLKSDDFYYAAYQFGGLLSPAGNNFNVLPTGQQAPNYSVNLLRVSYLYSFQ